MKERLDKSSVAREQITVFRVLNIDFFPRESHLVTFRDPWSFPILFHPACNNLIRQHMEDLAQKVPHPPSDTLPFSNPYRLSACV